MTSRFTSRAQPRRVAVRQSSSSHVVVALLAFAAAAFSSVATAAPTFDVIDLSSQFSLASVVVGNTFAGAGTTHDGRVVFAPYEANHVGVFNPKLMEGSVEDAFKLYDTNLVMGSKFYSAVTVGDGRVVFPPFKAGGIGVFDGRSNTFSMYGEHLTYTGNAYNGGGVASDGKVVMCPYQDSYLATLDLDTYEVSKTTAPGWVSPFGWHGGSVTLDGRVVCAPFNANTVLVYSSGSITNVAASVNNFVGATTLFDGRIFMAPWQASAVGIFDPSTNGFTTDSTDSMLPSGQAESFGGIVTAPDGRVLFQEHGISGNTHLFDPTDDSLISVDTRYPSGSTTRSWWGAASVGGLVVFTPRNVAAVGVLKVTCGEDEHVVSGACVRCPPGHFNLFGDRPDGPDTACDAECTCARQLNKVGLSYA